MYIKPDDGWDTDVQVTKALGASQELAEFYGLTREWRYEVQTAPTIKTLSSCPSGQAMGEQKPQDSLLATYLT